MGDLQLVLAESSSRGIQLVLSTIKMSRPKKVQKEKLVSRVCVSTRHVRLSWMCGAPAPRARSRVTSRFLERHRQRSAPVACRALRYVTPRARAEPPLDRRDV